MTSLLCTVTVLSLLFISSCLYGQDHAADSATYPSTRFIEQTFNRVEKLDGKLLSRTKKTLRKMQKEEQRLQRKLERIDAAAAKELFGSVQKQYSELEEKLFNVSAINNKRLNNYIPYLDSLKNGFAFLQDVSQKIPQLPAEKLQETLARVTHLQDRFEQVGNIQRILRERKQFLQQQLSKFGLAKQLKHINKEVYYYSQMIRDYKQIISDPKKLETHAIAVLRNIPAFREFMTKNSFISSVFGLPGTPGTMTASLNGVQTRASVQQAIQAALPAGNGSSQFVGQQVQQGTSQVQQLKEKISFADLSGNPEPMPDFKPNAQKTKSFFQRLEYGLNVQFGKVNRFLPTHSEVAVTLGYKLSDNGVLGIGSSYKLGLGSGLSNIRFTHQGFGMRSFLDWKIKAGFYLSGGYEKNFLPALQLINVPEAIPLWQQSGLIGAVKKYPLGKKRKGYVQLLYDFLHQHNIPHSQAFLFRTGFNF